ncbi:hypothetical protein NIES4072_17470 [Nostoc commune NIES-4072]|uniref:Uncharacterized protein n=1 Tax=Nostoc commune NIES-4072 TaxID=2005467 RepID=A0A2R5FPB8_NOSCO|nr:hypothetical protein NIES4070_09340 [Nostoc commune HK-02]GBG18083.1 hypothetical protein NIES4072_17470 [Nostoc commune NIES-4072]
MGIRIATQGKSQQIFSSDQTVLKGKGKFHPFPFTPLLQSEPYCNKAHALRNICCNQSPAFPIALIAASKAIAT